MKFVTQSGHCVVSCGGPAWEGAQAHRRGGLCARLSGMLGTPGSWQREGGGSSPGREDETERTGYGGTAGGKATKLRWNVSDAVCWQIVRRVRVRLFLP